MMRHPSDGVVYFEKNLKIYFKRACGISIEIFEIYQKNLAVVPSTEATGAAHIEKSD